MQLMYMNQDFYDILCDMVSQVFKNKVLIVVKNIFRCMYEC